MTVPSSAALRMRRSRDRRRQGDVIVSLEVAPKVTADLVELGWVPAHVCGDKDVLAHALTELVERAIEARVTPALSSPGKVSFMLEIQHSTIETLVGLISLDDLPHDPDRVFGAQRGR
jgi:hypothetical protein